MDPADNAPYGRVFYTLMHLLINDVSEAEFAQLSAAVRRRYSNPHRVELALGRFDSDALPTTAPHIGPRAELDRALGAFKKAGLE